MSDFQNPISPEVDEILVKSKPTKFFGIYENKIITLKKDKPFLVLLIGPTGSGKSTFIKALIEAGFHKVTTATTRDERKIDEPEDSYIWMKDKKDPYESEEFFIKRLTEKYGLVETNIFAEHIYGTPRKSVEIAIEDGNAVLGIENNGAKKILKEFNKVANVVIFFILPDSFDEIKRRVVTNRNDLSERLEIAKREIAESSKITNYYIHNTELPLYSKNDETPLEHSKENLVNFINYLIDSTKSS